MKKTLPPVSVVGSGPNGLAAAAHLALAGFPVTVYEANATPGGGCRSREFTLPGFVHDVCSTVHPLGISSPAFRPLKLEEAGVEWLTAPLTLAHPFDGGECVFLTGNIEDSAKSLGSDGGAYRSLMAPFVREWEHLLPGLLAPAFSPVVPPALARFGLKALRSARGLAESRFKTKEARALFAGIAAHAMITLEAPGSAAFGLVLGVSLHAVGWPVARGGSHKVTDALLQRIKENGGEIITRKAVKTPSDIEGGGPLVLTFTPRQLLSFGEKELPAGYREKLRAFRYGGGVCKVDWALSEPIPWRNEECKRALSVHAGGTLEEIAANLKMVHEGGYPEKPFVIVVQPTVADPSRAPGGKHVGWAYCHVPNGSDFDMTGRIEAQIERFAPGFRDVILARHTLTAKNMEIYDPNYVGGDIGSGANNLMQTLFRPVVGRSPHRIPVPGWYLCSASTRPGGGVHGMCGYHAARNLIEDFLGKN
ncbi:NAD(P)/FAD-dependent oxidoreductase [bacterium]|nr:MAG: NAD(P)/FAD-dependent oxidoreductase [bacterium]